MRRFQQRCRGPQSTIESEPTKSLPILASPHSREERQHAREVCHDCLLRPKGCWKAREYGCNKERDKARERQIDAWSCPLKLWGPAALPETVFPAFRKLEGQAFIDGFRAELAKDFLVPKLEGDGIVTLGEGKFWPGIVVMVRLLREVGCTLPVQVWHKGPVPQDLDNEPGVTLHELTGLAPVLTGWPNKTVALKHCGLRRALFIDADAYYVRDPSYLLEHVRDVGLAYWRDLHSQDWQVNWPAFGMDTATGQRIEPVQGGHFVINLELFWRELQLCDWLNQQSHYSYRHGFGDQDMIRVVLAATGAKFKMLGHSQCTRGAYLVDNPITIVHRAGAKLFPGTVPRRWERFPKEDRVFELFAQLSPDYPQQKQIILAWMRAQRSPATLRARRQARHPRPTSP